MCKNCTKSKRDCAGYAQPLVYKQQTQGHGDPNHNGDQFSFQEPLMTPTLNLQWQSEQQNPGYNHGFLQSDPSPYQQLPLSASYYAIPFPPQNVPHPLDGVHKNGNYSSQNHQAFPRQALTVVSNATAGSGFQNHGNAAPNVGEPLSYDLQVVEQQLYHTSNPSLNATHTTLPAFSPGNYIYPLEQPHPLQYQQRSASLSHQYYTPPISADGMWSTSTVLVGAYVC